MTGKLLLPVIPLKGITMLPGTIAHFDVNKVKAIKALENVMINDQKILLINQIKDNDDEIKVEDLSSVGTIVIVKQLVKVPNTGVVRLLVEGLNKAKLIEVTKNEPFVEASVNIDNDEELSISENENQAILRMLKEMLAAYLMENPTLNKDVFQSILALDDAKKLIDQVAVNVIIKNEMKQNFLEADSYTEKFNIVSECLGDEIEINRIKREYEEKVKEKIDENQKDYVLREQIKVIRRELGEDDEYSDADEFSKQLANLKASKSVKDKIEKEISRFKNASSNSSESSVIRGYIETLLEMPWDKKSRDSLDIVKAKEILEEKHYGMEKIKERILEYIAVRTFTKGKIPSPIVCLVGPPGTGKTSIAKSLAEAVNKKYIRISLGGIRDEAEIRGHRRTYIGAMHGRIATGIKQAGVKNPLILLDEIDKLGNDYKGDPSAALLEVLDSEQNIHFSDHYIEIPIDLSEVLFIATANDPQTIPRPLLDRMEIIEVHSYTKNEKEHIANEHLIKKQMLAHGLSNRKFEITKKAVSAIIQMYTREAGVRNLERNISELCRKAAKEILETGCKKVIITDENLSEYLGKIKYDIELANEKDDIGIVRGLAWTSVGGDTLEIEVNTMPGKGEMIITGKIGDVMQESAIAAKTYARSVAKKYNIEDTYFLKHDIHIHIPEGAVPKDGPSAGITMATAMISAISQIPVKASVAMTGEVTLRGKVLQIGGLKEKMLAAKVAGIKTVIVPEKNKMDVEEISEEIKKGIKIEFVSTMEEVLNIALRK